DGPADFFALTRRVAIAADDERYCLGRARLERQRVECAQQLSARRRARTRNDDGMDSGWHSQVSLCAEPRESLIAHGVAAKRKDASAGLTLELAALALAQPAPDAEALVVAQCVLEALASNIAR